jgi:hypothetical protein
MKGKAKRRLHHRCEIIDKKSGANLNPAPQQNEKNKSKI